MYRYTALKPVIPLAILGAYTLSACSSSPGIDSYNTDPATGQVREIAVHDLPGVTSLSPSCGPYSDMFTQSTDTNKDSALFIDVSNATSSHRVVIPDDPACSDEKIMPDEASKVLASYIDQFVTVDTDPTSSIEPADDTYTQSNVVLTKSGTVQSFDLTITTTFGGHWKLKPLIDTERLEPFCTSRTDQPINSSDNTPVPATAPKGHNLWIKETKNPSTPSTPIQTFTYEFEADSFTCTDTKVVASEVPAIVAKRQAFDDSGPKG